MSGSFEDKLGARLSAAKSKADEVERADREARAAEAEQSRLQTERFHEVKNRAIGFKNRHLEPLFKKLQQAAKSQGIRLDGNFVNDEDRGQVGSSIEAGERCYVAALIQYGLGGSTVRIAACAPQKGICFSESQEFNADTSLPWIEEQAMEALARLIETGEAPKYGGVTYNGRTLD